jgi:hypothetical protein
MNVDVKEIIKTSLPIGFTGSRGFTGSQGIIGFTGSQGIQGFTGSQGIQGFSGSRGIQGFTGSQGVIGFTGSQGIQGFTGSQGIQGFSGSQGIQGFTGSQGVIGFTGSTGFIGSRGFTGSKGLYGWETKTANYTAVNLDAIIANTSGGSFTITLPATPVLGTTVAIVDPGFWDVNPLTVARNGSTIEGVADDFSFNVKNVRVELVYDGSTWQIFTSVSGGASVDNVEIVARNTSTATHYISFVENVSGIQRIYTDTGLTFTPTSNLLSISGNILPGTNNPTDSGQNLGGTGNKWNTVYATTFSGTATNALYADLAENYLSDAYYEPGTVMTIGGTCEVTQSYKDNDTAIIGVVSTKPAYLMNSGLEGENVMPIALQGRVPCKVVGKVQAGDLIVSSNILGYGVVNNTPLPGTIIGKALVSKNENEAGIVEILVTKG